MSLTEDLWAEDPLDRELEFEDGPAETEEAPRCEVVTRLERAEGERSAA